MHLSDKSEAAIIETVQKEKKTNTCRETLQRPALEGNSDEAMAKSLPERRKMLQINFCKREGKHDNVAKKLLQTRRETR